MMTASYHQAADPKVMRAQSLPLAGLAFEGSMVFAASHRDASASYDAIFQAIFIEAGTTM